MTSSKTPLVDATIRIDRLPATGREIEVVPGVEALGTIAEQMSLAGLDRLHARLAAVPFRGGIRVQGRLEATVIQPSVVSLEPVTQEIDEPIDRIFLPEPDKAQKPSPSAEVFVDLEEDDLPDFVSGHEVDLGPLLLETLSLALDPYPRLPGETLDSLGLKNDDEDEGPFARLKLLQNPPDKAEE